MADCERMIRKWKSKITCEKCKGPQIVEEWERSPFHYHIRCPRCKKVSRKRNLNKKQNIPHEERGF